ncbi:MAG: DUF2934 domain-containing protein [Nitrospira sp.]|nr:DUF2934 domain-containing protein [Nitrospira sp.]MDH4305543.1 DUF2934 domain-containing protein [Nitrospira sp.]MDH5195120.1 DUF2934 domain-containing protein [Nitrospira sp.]
MQPQATNEPRRRKGSQPIPKSEPAVSEKEPVHCQPVSPCDDLQARITSRAYVLHAERGYRQGYALDDWLEAEREILGLECNA